MEVGNIIVTEDMKQTFQRLPGFNGRTKEHKNDLWCLDTDTWTWSLVTPSGLGPNPRRRQALVRVGDKIFLFGGTR